MHLHVVVVFKHTHNTTLKFTKKKGRENEIWTKREKCFKIMTVLTQQQQQQQTYPKPLWKRERIIIKTGVRNKRGVSLLHDTQNTFSFKKRCDAVGRSRERERERERK